MIKNLLLVEGFDDKIFINGLLRYIKNNNLLIEQLLTFDFLQGSDVSIIKNKLASIVTELRTNPIQQLGIILDIDNYTSAERVQQLNEAVSLAFNDFTEEEFNVENNTISLNITQTKKITFSYYLMKAENGKGNTESLLKDIVNMPTLSANCLELWKKCSVENGIKISSSQFLKEWVKFYIRYDYCKDRSLSKHVKDNCNLEKSIDNIFLKDKPNAWNFEHVALNDLKKYLSTFSNA